MFTVLIFLAVIAVLVLSHEFGHFIVAKMRGMRVDEFGFGFPPKLFGKKFGETEYTFNLLPFGGFVKIWGEDETEETTNMQNFTAHSIGSKLAVIVAGVIMNILLAYILFTAGHAIGLPTVVDETTSHARNVQVQIIEVVAHSPAAEAGLLPGDAITNISRNGENISIVNIEEVQEVVSASNGAEIMLTVLRGDETIAFLVMPRIDPPAGEGALGIAMLKTGIVSAAWYRAPWEGLKTTAMLTVAVVEGLWSFFANLFAAGEVIGDVAGPVGIAQVAGQAGRLGFIYLLQLTALLSINLAILNLLPIPALDGGRMFFLIIEKVRGVPINARFAARAHATGFIALIILMLLITYKDIVRIF
jgi:regulator of sigma E protease